MPRLKRRMHRRRVEYDENHHYALLTGTAFFCFHDRTGPPDKENFEAMREAWEHLRDGLLPQFIYEHPCERPWAWWKFDAPERRRRIDGELHPFDDLERNERLKEISGKSNDPEKCLKQLYKLTFGRPACSVGYDNNLLIATYESDIEYLHRLNLLTPQERQLIVEYNGKNGTEIE